MNKNRGFTLVEIAIVIAIISVMAAIAIPNLMRARTTANESAAVSSLRAVAAAQATFRAANNRYATSFTELTHPPQGPAFLDGDWGGAAKNGYVVAMTATANGFAVTATPEAVGSTGTCAFFVDQTNVIRFVDGAGPATATSTPYDQR